MRKIRGMCTIKDCGQPHRGHGYCNSHYQKFYLFGEPLGKPERKLNFKVEEICKSTILERFERNFEKLDKNSCWLWKKALNGSGYGSTRIRSFSKSSMAHRISYELYIGEIPKGLYVCHSCDIPSCVNPNHLFLGTQSDNNKDMKSKNRGNYDIGSQCHNAKLNEEKVLSILEDLKNGISCKKLGLKHRISYVQISMIKSGKAWKHVTNRRA